MVPGFGLKQAAVELGQLPVGQMIAQQAKSLTGAGLDQPGDQEPVHRPLRLVLDDQLVQSLARAGVDALTQQELYSSALQADLDRTSWFSARVIAALERASQRPLAEAG